MKTDKAVNLGYKYRFYCTKEQMNILNHQMFIYNQAYNICLNLWKKENDRNKDLPKELKSYKKAIENAQTPKAKAYKLCMPTFKSSRDIFQSFNI